MRDTGTDDPRVRVRPPRRGSRPRTKIRPDYSDAPEATCYRVDRGRYQLRLDDRDIVAVTARELGRGAVVVGDRVKVVGDLSGREGSLARIVAVTERETALRRSAEEGESARTERVIVANADQLLITAALAQPEPRTGMIDRCLVAAYDAGMEPILVLTKADLAEPDELLKRYAGLGLRVLTTSMEPPSGIEAVAELLPGHSSVLIGHSGVGKSTLINALIPEADRATGGVNVVTGRGRHTSSAAIAFDVPGGGMIIDTPGVRSFGLAHVEDADIIGAFPDLAELSTLCPRGCDHGAGSDCALDEGDPERVASLRRLLGAREEPEEADEEHRPRLV